jgi:hypothetical protein
MPPFLAFTCIPAILNEYQTAELNVRTGCSKALSFVFEYVGPQSEYCFETSLHVTGAVMEAIEAMRVTLGPGVLLSYVLQGLFHPARKVREVSCCCITYLKLSLMASETGLLVGIYLGAQDALVPFYPDLGELSEGQNFIINIQESASSGVVIVKVACIRLLLGLLPPKNPLTDAVYDILRVHCGEKPLPLQTAPPRR